MVGLLVCVTEVVRFSTSFRTEMKCGSDHHQVKIFRA